MGTFVSTPPANYALGRNTVVALTFNAKSTSTGFKTVSLELCISQGQVAIDTDTIEIPSNCQSGWKVKLPGLKSGTVTGTGYVASSSITATGLALSTPGTALDIMQFLGEPASVTISAPTQVIQGTSLVEDDPFTIGPTIANPVNGFFKASNVALSPDAAVNLDFTIELSGAQAVSGFVAISGAVSTI